MADHARQPPLSGNQTNRTNDNYENTDNTRPTNTGNEQAAPFGGPNQRRPADGDENAACHPCVMAEQAHLCNGQRPCNRCRVTRTKKGDKFLECTRAGNARPRGMIDGHINPQDIQPNGKGRGKAYADGRAHPSGGKRGHQNSGYQNSGYRYGSPAAPAPAPAPDMTTAGLLKMMVEREESHRRELNDAHLRFQTAATQRNAMASGYQSQIDEHQRALAEQQRTLVEQQRTLVEQQRTIAALRSKRPRDDAEPDDARIAKRVSLPRPQPGAYLPSKDPRRGAPDRGGLVGRETRLEPRPSDTIPHTLPYRGDRGENEPPFNDHKPDNHHRDVIVRECGGSNGRGGAQRGRTGGNRGRGFRRIAGTAPLSSHMIGASRAEHLGTNDTPSNHRPRVDGSFAQERDHAADDSHPEPGTHEHAVEDQTPNDPDDGGVLLHDPTARAAETPSGPEEDMFDYDTLFGGMENRPGGS